MIQDPADKLQRSLLTRRRFQYAGALVVGAGAMFVLRGTLLPGLPGEPARVNALIGNVLAITIAFWCGPAAAHEQPVTTPAARFVQDTLDHALILVRPPVSAEKVVNEFIT